MCTRLKIPFHHFDNFVYNCRMATEHQDEKLRLPARRIILIFIGLFIVFEILCYATFQYQNWWPLETSFYFYTPCLLGVSVLFCVLSITQTYYVVDKSRIIHVRMGKVFEYNFRDILFIDEKWSEKHKMLLFYDKSGNARYLAFDKKHVIYDYALEYSHLVSEEEFRNMFPKIKL